MCFLQDDKDTYRVFLPKRHAEAYKDMDAYIALLQPGVLGLTVTNQFTLVNGTVIYELDIDYCKR